MQLRRLSGLLCGICTLSLTLGPSNNGCERRNVEATSTAASVPTSHHAGMHGSPVSADKQQPCNSSAPVCCQAMTSCGPTIVLSRTASADAQLPAAAAVAPPTLEIPNSRTAAPEPPPPKA